MTELHKEEDSVPFYPDHVLTEFRVVLGILVIVVLIGIYGMLNPVGMEEPADPLNTPLHVKPEWYFLALYQLLKYISKTAGAVIPVILMVFFLVLPFIDRKPDQSKKPQKVRFIISAVGMVVLIALTIWGGR